MVQTITVNNDLNLFYTELSSIINRMYNNNYTINRTVINTNTYYIRISSGSRVILDMYALNLFPDTESNNLKQIVLCNNLTITDDEIDFSTFSTNNIGPCFYSYDSNGNVTQNNYWITNRNYILAVNDIVEPTLDTETYYRLYQCCINSIVMPTNDYNEIQYLWIGLKSYNEDTALSFISITDKNNIGMFGINSELPTNTSAYIKAVTTQSNVPIAYDMYKLTIPSTVISLSVIPIYQSINHEYFPYLFYCIGRDKFNSEYLQFTSTGVEYLVGLNGLLAVTSNPKFTLKQQIIYTINIFDTSSYTFDALSVIDNQATVSIDWGDSSNITNIPANSSNLNPTHNYNATGVYNITVSYQTLTNPHYINNIANIDQYTTQVSFRNASQLTQLDAIDIFKYNGTLFDSMLTSVILPTNLTSLYANGFCENCINLTNLVLPTSECTIEGQWLYNAALAEGIADSYTYPANLTFTKDNLYPNFYTGNFSNNIIINSDIDCFTLYVSNAVTTLTLNGDIRCNTLTADTEYNETNNSALTTLIIDNDCNFNQTEIENLPNLTTIEIRDESATTFLPVLQNLNSLTTLNVSDNIGVIQAITNCNALTSLYIPENVATIDNLVGLYCNNLTEFVVDENNTEFSSTNGIIYSKDGTQLINIPYAYEFTDFSIPNTVTTISPYALCVKNTIPTINLTSNIQTVSELFIVDSTVNTLNIDTDILSDIVFSAATVNNLVLSENVTALSNTAFIHVNITSLTVYNESITLLNTQFNLNELSVIKGYVGSTAETFALNNNITFIPIDIGNNQTKYIINIPTNNYIVHGISSLSQSYTLIDWGDSSESTIVYNLENALQHTYAQSGVYTVIMTHIAPTTIDFSLTNANTGLFAVATQLDFSALTLCSNTVTGMFNNLTNVESVIMPPNIISLSNSLSNCASLTTVTLPTELLNISSMFNETYNNITAITLPTKLESINNSFNNTNVLSTNSVLNTVSSRGLVITDSINSCSNIQSITIGANVSSITNSLMNLLNLSTLTCDSNNTNIASSNNLLFNYDYTRLLCVPGGLATFTIPNSVVTLVQGSIANSKTYTNIIIPETVTTIIYPFYNSKNDTQQTTITNLTVLNPYLSMENINKVNSVTNNDTTTYYDTANVITITGYEHSVIHSQTDGYDRYPNCSSYNFTSLGYYNSDLIIGSDYTDATFTDNQLATISNNLISFYDNYYNYIIPDTNVHKKETELITYICNNNYDFISNENPYVIFYYIDTVNNTYEFIAYVLSVEETASLLNINSSSTYNVRKINVTYNLSNQEYSINSTDTNFSNQVISLPNSNYAVLALTNELTIMDNGINITPTYPVLEYTTLLQVSDDIPNTFNGYVLGSTETGTNKLFLSNPIIRSDDYWLNVNSTTISADNIVSGLNIIVDNQGNIVKDSVSGELPLTFISNGNSLIDYKLYGTSDGAGVQTENLFNANNRQSSEGFWNNMGGYIPQTGWYGSLKIPVKADTEYTFNPHSTAGSSAKHLFYNATNELIGNVASGKQTFTTPANCSSMVFSFRTSSYDITLYEGSAISTFYIPYGYKLPMTMTSGVYNLVDIESISLLSNDRYGIVIDAPGTYTITAFANSSTYVYCRSYDANNDPISDNLSVVSSSGTITTRTLTINQGEKIYVFDPITTATFTSVKAKFTNDYIVAVSGSTPPDHYIPHHYSTTTPIYIGDTKLSEEEYVDYENGKVWKQRDNLFDAEQIVEDSVSTASTYIEDGWLHYNTGPNPITINVDGQVGETFQFKLYIKNFSTVSSNNMRFVLHYSDGTSVITASNSYAAGISRYAQFASNPDKELVSVVSQNTSNRTAGIEISKSLIVKSDTMPETYLNPTDPPVALPEISTYNGENTLSCDSSLGSNNEITLNLDVATEVTNIEENVTTLKLLRTDKYMFENNVELVSSTYSIS